MLGVFVHEYVLSRVQLLATPWTVVPQAALCLGFPRQEYWIRLPFPSPWDVPDPGIKPTSLLSPALADGFICHCATCEATIYQYP